MMNFSEISQKIPWIESGDIRPYVFVRPENQIQNPGARHKAPWFPHEPVLKNPLDLGAGLGGYLRMNAESADKTPAFCNAFPQYNSQTKSYLVFTAVHCFGSNNVPAGEFYLSQNIF